MSQFDRFTEDARHVLTLAQEEAYRFNRNYIGTEHLLLGLVREKDSIAARVLQNMGLQLPKVRSAVEFIIGRGDTAVTGEISLTPRARKVIELALDESRRLGHKHIGTEHLLLGLVLGQKGMAAGVLESLGVDLESVRAQVKKEVADNPLPLSDEEFTEVDQVVQSLPLFELLLAFHVPEYLPGILSQHLVWPAEKLKLAFASQDTLEIIEIFVRSAAETLQKASPCYSYDALYAVSLEENEPSGHGKDCPYCSMIINALQQQHVNAKASAQAEELPFPDSP